MPTIPNNHSTTFKPRFLGGQWSIKSTDRQGLETAVPPDAVTDLAAGTPGATSVTLTFTLPEGATATFYRRNVTADGEYEQIATGVAVGSYNATGLTPNENVYQFKNTLTNAYGTSADSNVVSVTTAELGESPLQVEGTFAQGNTVSITTDGSYNFGTRASKVLLAFDGTNKAGSSWGRDTTDYWQSGATISTAKTVGEMPNSIRWDFKGTSAAITNELVPFDPDKLYRQSTARYYDFDITSATYQNEANGFNLKTDRWWKDEGVTLADLYIGYQGSEGDNSCRMVVEGIDQGGANYTGVGIPPETWLRELMLFQNSSDIDEPDGFCKHYRNGVFVNFESDPEDLYVDKHRFITKSATYPLGMSAKAFDQVSNGVSETAPAVPMYLGYCVIDDEVAGVFVSDQPTIDSGEVLEYQLPHDNWTTTSIDVFALCPIPAASAYLYILLSNGSWLTTTGLKAVPA